MKKTLLVFAASLLLTAPAVKAQSPAAPAATAPATPGQRKAAGELLQAMQAEKNLQTTVDQMLKMQLQQRPEMKALEPEVRAFMGKYMSWPALKDEMVNLYAREFSEQELKELTKFYQTPTGQKLMSKQGMLTQAGMEMGQRNVQAHLPELQQTIQAKMQGQGQAPATAPVK